MENGLDDGSQGSTRCEGQEMGFSCNLNVDGSGSLAVVVGAGYFAPISQPCATREGVFNGTFDSALAARPPEVRAGGMCY